MKEKTPSLSQSSHAHPANEAGQILHLKQLLVTLKQQYEKNLQQLNEQLQNESSQKQALQQAFDQLLFEQIESKKQHEEEQSALRQQQMTLRDFLKKTQEDLRLLQDTHKFPLNTCSQTDLITSQKRVDQLEQAICYLKRKIEDSNKEKVQFREEADRAHQKIQQLQSDFVQKQRSYQKQVDELQQILTLQEQKQVSPQQESVYRELEAIKQILAGYKNETLGLEGRYVELLNEKTALENQFIQLQQQLERQSSSLIALNEQTHELGLRNKELEQALENATQLLIQSQQENREAQQRISELDQAHANIAGLQDNYEQLKDEVSLLKERLEENCEARLQAEKQLEALQEMTKSQQVLLLEQEQQLIELKQEREHLQQDIERLHQIMEEGEARIKMAQQHLAKKVKEAALLNEKVEEQQADLMEHQQIIESTKAQIQHLQSSIDTYQKQEKRLQDQLNESLRTTESQIAKWEEKYFHMCDKWQESEIKIRELKKFEEKHLQMQSLLANLGNFMGSTPPSGSALFQSSLENLDRLNRSESLEEGLKDKQMGRSLDHSQEKYNLFETRSEQDKFKPHLFS